MDTLLAQFALLIYTVYNSNRACRRQVIRKKVKDMKSSSKQPNSKMTPVLGLLAVVVGLALLSACGGGNQMAVNDITTPIKEVVVPTPTPVSLETPRELVGKKNAGGITYTAGKSLLDGVTDADSDKDGIPDRVAEHILALYKGSDASSTAKVEALKADAKEYGAVLALTYSELPKTKEEAARIIYTEVAFNNFCAFEKAFSMNEFEAASREMFLSNLNSALKVQRYREIEKLAGYQDLSRNCK